VQLLHGWPQSAAAWAPMMEEQPERTWAAIAPFALGG